MVKKELDGLVEKVIDGVSSAEQIIYDCRLNYPETLYFMKHLTSELVDKEPERLIHIP